MEWIEARYYDWVCAVTVYYETSSHTFFLTFALIISILVSWSCESVLEFKPSGTNYHLLQQPNPPSYLSITLRENAETLNAWGTVQVKYKLVTRPEYPVSVQLYIDSTLVSSGAPDSVIWFDTELFHDGYHDFKLLLLTPTHSGSLASRLGAEFFVKSVVRTIHIDNMPPSTPIGIAVTPNSGTLVLRWQPYTRTNFQEYTILKIKRDVYGTFHEFPLATIYDSAVGEYHDSTFIGDTANYRVDLHARGILLRGTVETFATERPVFSQTELLSDATVALRWSATRFPSNLDRYEIWMGSFIGTHYYGTLLKQTSNPSDTSFIDQMIGFGAPTVYTIIVHSKQNAGIKDSVYSESNIVYVGNSFYNFQTISYNAPLHSIYLNGPRKLRLDPATLTILAETDGDVSISEDGIRGCKIKQGTTYEINPLTLQTIRTLDLSAFLESGRIEQREIYLTTPNNYLFLNTSYQPIIVHIDSMRLLSNPYLSQCKISTIANNGQYFSTIGVNCGGCGCASIYKITNGQTSFHFGFPSDINDYFCFDKFGDRFVVTLNNTISYRNSIDNSVIAEYIMGSFFRSPSIDPVTGYLGVVTNTNGWKYLVIDLSNGNIVHEVKILRNFWSEKIFLINNILFSNGSVYWKL